MNRDNLSKASLLNSIMFLWMYIECIGDELYLEPAPAQPINDFSSVSSIERDGARKSLISC